MIKKIFICLLILFCGLISIVLCGCKRNSIEFNTQTRVQNILNDVLPNKKDEVIKSSGIVIYRDNTSEKQNGNVKKNEIRFGPRDINFDMPLK